MATLRESLIIRQANIGRELEAITNTDRGAQGYKQGLYDELRNIQRMLKDPTVDLDGNSGPVTPFEIISGGVT